MRAIATTYPTNTAESLTIEEATDPTNLPLPRQHVSIAVEAAGVNRADVLQRRGLYPPPSGASKILGLEVAGRIIAVGDDSTSPWKAGDSVVALLSGGGYAERVVVDSRCLLPLPENMSFVQGAAIPEVAATVWWNLVHIAQFCKGQRLFVHGGTSGIGCMAIQLAKNIGAQWIGTTVGNETKQAATIMMGADLAVIYPVDDFVAQTIQSTQSLLPAPDGDDDSPIPGVDIVLDIVGAPYTSRNMEILRNKGRLIQLALMAGSRSDTLSLAPLLKRQLTWSGSTLRSISPAEKGEILRGVQNDIWPLLASQAIRIPIHATFPLERACDAHALMESSAHIGKIVLTL